MSDEDARRSGAASATYATYDEAAVAGADAVRRGDFAAALDAYGTSAELARSEGDPTKIDKAALNIAMARLQAGDAGSAEEGLREILLRSREPRLAFTAAYHLASSLRKRGKLEKARGYAHRAMERASALAAPDLIASTRNLLGNILVLQSRFEEAIAEYRSALATWDRQPGDTRYLRAILLENLGYALVVSQHPDEGIAMLTSAKRLADEVGDLRCRAEALQDLCYGSLLRDDLGAALGFGKAALDLSTRMRYDDIEENCHYLLGEIGSRSGDARLRDEHFGMLQERHPELPQLKELLCAIDVTQIITLRR